MPGSRLGFATWEDPGQIISLPYTTHFVIKIVYLGFISDEFWYSLVAYHCLLPSSHAWKPDLIETRPGDTLMPQQIT